MNFKRLGHWQRDYLKWVAGAYKHRLGSTEPVVFSVEDYSLTINRFKTFIGRGILTKAEGKCQFKVSQEVLKELVRLFG